MDLQGLATQLLEAWLALVAAKLTETVRKGLSAPGMAEKFVAFSVPLAVAGPDEVTRITTRESNDNKKIMETVPIKFE